MAHPTANASPSAEGSRRQRPQRGLHQLQATARDGVPGTGPGFSYDPEQHRSKQHAPDAATIYRLDLLRYPPEHDGHVRPVSINGITAAVSRERSANRVDALE